MLHNKLRAPVSLALAALLLTSCAAPAAQSAATVETAAAPAQQSLTAYADASLRPAVQAYADAQGVALTFTEDLAAAQFVAADYLPTGAELLDPASDTLLAAAAARADTTNTGYTLPVGRSLYGYWASEAVLKSLLGDGAVEALQNATYTEWSDFADTLQAWLAAPKETAVTLNGQTLTLPAEKPENVTATGVFATPTDRASGYTAAILAADGNYTAEALAGPLNGVYSAVTLEMDDAAQSDDTAVFRRAKLTDLNAVGNTDGLVLIPFKTQLDESDLSTEEYNLTGLLNYPVLAESGYLAVNAAADDDGKKAAESAVLWLYSSGSGEKTLTETLQVITPWNTASDATDVGAMQVEQASKGILPGTVFTDAQAAALAANEEALRGGKRGKTERADFTKAALAALGVADSE